MKYEEAEMRCLDIDWFCTLNGVKCHFASNGGQLPAQVNDTDYLNPLLTEVIQMPKICEASINRDAVEIALSYSANQTGDIYRKRKNYIATFKTMAERGFVSYDRINLENPDDNTYFAIAYPKNPQRTAKEMTLKLPLIELTETEGFRFKF